MLHRKRTFHRYACPLSPPTYFSYNLMLKAVSVQVRSDWYVYAVLSSLPWVGKELYEKKDVEMDRLLNQIEGYLKCVLIEDVVKWLK